MRLVVDARTSAFAALIDYAGVFPPAALSVQDAVAGYRAVRDAPSAWVAGRFLIRASQLEDLAAAVTSTMRHGEAPWETSVVFDIDPREAASRAADFHAEMEPAMTVAAAEAPIVDTSTAGVQRLFTTVGSITPEVVPFLEITRDADVTAQIRAIAACISDAGRTGGAKLRCGGITPDLFPSPDEVAEFIMAVIEARVPFKATAGLHHPVRHHDPTIGTHRHGFVNILVATAAAAQGADRSTVAAIVAETDADAFRVSAAFASWRSLSIPGSALRRVRQESFVAYGSCDFDEPVTALASLGMMGEGT
jgi:hypothetical protein